MKKEELESAVVYRVVVSGGQNKLAQLIGVVSPNPEETLRHWMEHASVLTIDPPVLRPGLDGTTAGIDHVIKAIDKPPYYTVLNRLEQSQFERMLVAKE